VYVAPHRRRYGLQGHARVDRGRGHLRHPV